MQLLVYEKVNLCLSPVVHQIIISAYCKIEQPDKCPNLVIDKHSLVPAFNLTVPISSLGGDCEFLDLDILPQSIILGLDGLREKSASVSGRLTMKAWEKALGLGMVERGKEIGS